VGGGRRRARPQTTALAIGGLVALIVAWFAGDDAMFGGQGNDFLEGRTGTNFNDGGTESDYCLNPSSGPGCP
jgi:Ca2+-binding RTX toxin-like protein